MLSELLLNRATAQKLHGVISHKEDINEEGAFWLERFVTWEERHRSQRSLDSRMRKARLGRFKPMSEFDWKWPKQCDRAVIEQWMQLGFMEGASNLILCGPNGVGKTMIVSNIASQAVLRGSTALFTTAAAMLNELAELDSDSALRRRIKYYTQPSLLVVDEVGYLSYSNRHADLLFEVVSQRYEKKSTCITTNKPIPDWRDIFPNATCVVSIVDRLLHHSEILTIDGDSFRLKEAMEKNKERNAKRKKSQKSTTNEENSHA
jgi:DNA replication protein DnaC